MKISTLILLAVLAALVYCGNDTYQKHGLWLGVDVSRLIHFERI